MLVCVTAILAFLLCIGCSTNVELDEWEMADQATIRLSPRLYPELPQNIKDDLEALGCTIPQEWSYQEPHNVIKGHFKDSKHVDWAVLCSVKQRSEIRVYWDGSVSSVSNIDAVDDKHWLQIVGEDRIGYSRRIWVADAETIKEYYSYYPVGELPKKLDHEGIDDAFTGKGSAVLYWYEGKWLRLQGMD